MAGVYSTRFILAYGAGVASEYVVPAGKRAVVKMLDAVELQGGAGNIYVKLAGIYVFGWPFTGAIQTVHQPMYCVAYAGEIVRLEIAQPITVGCAVTGYLFDDPGGRSPGRTPVEEWDGELVVDDA